MLKLIGADARRTHRGAHGGVGHSDREDSGHDPDAGCLVRVTWEQADYTPTATAVKPSLRLMAHGAQVPAKQLVTREGRSY